MNIEELKTGIPELIMQGLLFEVKEGEMGGNKDKAAQTVLTINLLQSQNKLKNGEEFTALESRFLTVKDKSTFGEYFNLQGQFISVPVGLMVREGNSIFWVPKGARPRKVNPGSMPPAMPANKPL